MPFLILLRVWKRDPLTLESLLLRPSLNTARDMKPSPPDATRASYFCCEREKVSFSDSPFLDLSMARICLASGPAHADHV